MRRLEEEFDKRLREMSRHSGGEGECISREVEDAAGQLATKLLDDKHPFQSAIKTISSKTTLTILSADEAAKWVDKTRNQISILANRVPAVDALPILLQVATEYYYGPNHEELQERLSWLGTALKSSFAFVWPKVFTEADTEKLPVSHLQELIHVVAVWEQLEGLRLGYEISGQEPATLTGKGFVISEKMAEVTVETRAVFGDRGRLHRTVHDTAEAIISQPKFALEAVEGILSGENPADQQIFEGTIFSGIPREPKEFWAGLWARFYLSMVCVQCCPTPYRVAVFPLIDREWHTRRQLPADLLQQTLVALYWNRAWYERRIKQDPGNMIVERPVARIKRSPGLFIATFPNTVDSLTWFVESSIGDYPESGGVRLSQAVFEQYVSKAFEWNALEIFRRHGYQAGEVTKNGVWILETSKVQLKHVREQRCPGQIDILAYDSNRNLVFVGDCKVLAYPENLARMRNLTAKISDQDSEGFHSDLNERVDWLLSVQGLGDRQDQNTVGIIILDRRLPGMKAGGKNIVCDLTTLESVLDTLP